MVSSVPRFVLFSLNWTPEMPEESEALAETETWVPWVMLELFEGEEREIEGGVVSEGVGVVGIGAGGTVVGPEADIKW